MKKLLLLLVVDRDRRGRRQEGPRRVGAPRSRSPERPGAPTGPRARPRSAPRTTRRRHRCARRRRSIVAIDAAVAHSGDQRGHRLGRVDGIERDPLEPRRHPEGLESRRRSARRTRRRSGRGRRSPRPSGGPAARERGRPRRARERRRRDRGGCRRRRRRRSWSTGAPRGVRRGCRPNRRRPRSCRRASMPPAAELSRRARRPRARTRPRRSSTRPRSGSRTAGRRRDGRVPRRRSMACFEPVVAVGARFELELGREVQRRPEQLVEEQVRRLAVAAARPPSTRWQSSPSRLAAAAVMRAWLLCTPPPVTSASQPCSIASAQRSSSLRALLPPSARPVRSSRLTNRWRDAEVRAQARHRLERCRERRERCGASPVSPRGRRLVGSRRPRRPCRARPRRCPS